MNKSLVGFRIHEIGNGNFDNFSASSVFLFVYVRSTEPSGVFVCQVMIQLYYTSV